MMRTWIIPVNPAHSEPMEAKPQLHPALETMWCVSFDPFQSPDIESTSCFFGFIKLLKGAQKIAS